MWDYICSHVGEIASVFTITATMITVMLWSHRRLNADMQEIKEDAKRAYDRIDLALTRIDAMGTRIDGLYHVMMEFLVSKK